MANPWTFVQRHESTIPANELHLWRSAQKKRIPPYESSLSRHAQLQHIAFLVEGHTGEVVVVVLAVFVTLFERHHIALALADIVKFLAVCLDQGRVELEVG